MPHHLACTAVAPTGAPARFTLREWAAVPSLGRRARHRKIPERRAPPPPPPLPCHVSASRGRARRAAHRRVGNARAARPVRVGSGWDARVVSVVVLPGARGPAPRWRRGRPCVPVRLDARGGGGWRHGRPEVGLTIEGLCAVQQRVGRVPIVSYALASGTVSPGGGGPPPTSATVSQLVSRASTQTWLMRGRPPTGRPPPSDAWTLTACAPPGTRRGFPLSTPVFERRG